MEYSNKEMDLQPDIDLNLLSEEKFDFDSDILLSPTSDKSDEDEVFIGPLGHLEKCIAVAIDLNLEEKKPKETIWNPISADKLDDVFREANLLAQQYEKHIDQKTTKKESKRIQNKMVEQFIEESQIKLNCFNKGIDIPITPRREAIVVQDSPQKQLISSVPENSHTCCTDHDLPLESFMKGAVQETKASMQPINGSASQSSLGKIEGASFDENRGTTEQKTLLGESLKCGTTKHFTEKFGLRKSLGPKPPGCMKRSNAGIIKTVNVASSTSSLNSSLHASPAVCKVNTSLKSSKLKAPNSSKLAAPTSKLSNSTQSTTKDIPNSKLIKPSTCKLTNLGNAIQQESGIQTPSSKCLQRISSVPNIKVNAKVKQNKSGNSFGKDLCPKSKPSFVPAPNSQALRKYSAPLSETRPKIMQPKRLLSCSAVVGVSIPASTPNKLLLRGMLQTPTIPNQPVSVTPSSRRLSVLPTPVNRRLSGIPAFTPRSQSRPRLSSNQTMVLTNCSMSASKDVLASTKRKQQDNAQAPNISDYSSGEDTLPLVPCSLDFFPDEVQAICQETANEVQAICQETAKEVPAEIQHINENLLVDLEVNTKYEQIEDRPVEVETKCVQVEDRPLIDFSNTPDLIKRVALKPVEQLIDLSSPLIKLSPGNKENVNLDSPLLKF
uniref:G2 and S phase-expressed protein 1 N-terminal domain-containing protein n=1 Tax=Callorhinchus milii TaxID=7868 RepID=A0A4W3HSH9_CALMI|eukprot:gi/632979351/ref/XP_007906419.1/ PREDICTED: G2 and S phase-expressed protein 1 [Callorhinchus milii]